jgi:hypothetical protein
VRYTLVHREVHGAASCRPDEFNKCITNSIFELYMRTQYSKEEILILVGFIHLVSTIHSNPDLADRYDEVKLI